MATPKQVYQLKVTLMDIEPSIWRRILIPSSYDFWQLHCTIQDAFGWTDSHMHKFTCTAPHSDAPLAFGIPFDAEYDDEVPVVTGWQHKITEYINGSTEDIIYIYDFGDYWQHRIELEEILPYEKGANYPRCITGERNCPPDDCGGPHGYSNLLEILFDPSDPEHEDTKEWVDSMKGKTFDPEEFNPSTVKFTKPGWRLKRLLEHQ